MNPTQNQPVAVSFAVGGLLTTGVALAAILYPDRLNQAVQVAIIAFGNSVILTAGAVYAMMKSTPSDKPRVEKGTSVEVLDKGQPTGDSVIVQKSPPGSVDVDSSPSPGSMVGG